MITRKKKRIAILMAFVLTFGILPICSEENIAEASTKGYTVSKSAGTYTTAIQTCAEWS